MRKIDLTGQRFGRLVVVGEAPARIKYRYRWAVRCDCGVGKEIDGHVLRSGRVVSCGCYKAAKTRETFTTHGRTRTPEWIVWRGMRNRCENPNEPAYQRYGGRGITVAPEWLDFARFFADMGERPPGRTLERRDNDGPYSRENCHWASRKAQARNRRSNRNIFALGRSQTLAAWAEETGIGHRTISERIRRGWPPDRAVTEAV